MSQVITGKVTSDKGDKTIIVTAITRKTHPLYKKQYTVTTKFIAHNENNQAKLGDTVTITECRPRSARKRFELTSVVEKAGIGFQESDATADIPAEEAAPAPADTAAPAKAASKPKSRSNKEAAK